ncbi:MAG: spore maturation protein [Proteobacteria bacterium]|nr:spore maturation protein [Pseudomonadota bacterium]MBU1685892.1 spore maturation protein [Pseudomonadota bacterium]
MSETATKPAAINIIWLSMILVATVTAAYTGRMDELTKASFDAAKSSVTLAIGLIGPMALWLGIMKVAEAGGLLRLLARAMRPLMTRLFPEVPPEHPAMSAMVMNLAANALGLGNAATPMGIKAMQELDKLAAEKGTATNAMCQFLAINTSSVTLLPLGVITVRAAAGAHDPAGILLPSLVATVCSTAVAIIAARTMAGPDCSVTTATSTKSAEGNKAKPSSTPRPGPIGRFMVITFVALMIGAMAYQSLTGSIPENFTGLVSAVSAWLIPIIFCGLLLFGYLRGVKVYESLTEGATEGFSTVIRIIPFMVAIFVAIGMLRASGALDLMIRFLSPLTTRVGLPAEALSMALLRPLSGSGAFGLMSEIVSRDPDSFLSYLVSVMQGSTETTFYVLAVYFGAVGIKRTRHALPAALCADAAGIIASVAVCNLLY